jgi:hypothetical protein
LVGKMTLAGCQTFPRFPKKCSSDFSEVFVRYRPGTNRKKPA